MRDLEQEVSQLVDLAVENATADTCRSIIDASTVTERFSIWLLAVSGAAGGLLVANLPKLTEFLALDWLRRTIWLLAASALLGLAARVLSSRLELYRTISGVVAERMGELINTYEKMLVDLEKIHNKTIDREEIWEMALPEYAKALSSITPAWKRKGVTKAFSKLRADPKSAERTAITKAFSKLRSDPKSAERTAMLLVEFITYLVWLQLAALVLTLVALAWGIS